MTRQPRWTSFVTFAVILLLFFSYHFSPVTPNTIQMTKNTTTTVATELTGAGATVAGAELLKGEMGVLSDPNPRGEKPIDALEIITQLQQTFSMETIQTRSMSVRFVKACFACYRCCVLNLFGGLCLFVLNQSRFALIFGWHVKSFFTSAKACVIFINCCVV